MDTVVYLVRQDPDHSADIHAFRDYDLATEAAAVVGGWIEEEPVMGADFVAELREQHRAQQETPS